MKVLNKRGKSGNRKQGCLVNAILENTHDLVNDEIKDKETKMTLWLLSWASEKKFDTPTENKKAEKGS